MLDKLSTQQVEQAFKHLSQPIQEAPPEPLNQLNEMEWFLLGRMLNSLLLEKDSKPLQ
jgi:hypothetical protein